MVCSVGTKSKEMLEIGIYKNLFEKAKEGMLLTNNKGIIKIVNTSFVNSFGYSSVKELVGKPIEIVIPKHLSEKHKAHVSGYLKAPKTRTLSKNKTLYGLKKDGSFFPVEISLSHLKNEDGQVLVLAFVVDVSERKKQEKTIIDLNSQLEKKVAKRTKELNKSYQLFSQIARNFPRGTINVFDKDLNYIFVEGQELYKLGINSRQLVGSNYLDRLAPSVSKEIGVLLAEVFKGASKTFEITTNENQYQINAVPLPEENGDIYRILVVEKNITEEKLAEEKIKKALQREKELNELKSRFVSMASHEFRTPLSAIYSSATLLGKYIKEEQQDKRDKHIDRIKTTVMSLTDILNDVLSLSKVEEGEDAVNIVEIEVEKYCKTVAEEIELIARRGQTIKYEHKGDEILRCDPVLMRKITLNLLSNAVKYSHNDGVIELLTISQENNFIIEVKDHGIGIPIAEQKELFKRFFRAGNVSNIEGTGLGLNIVKKYVELLNGKISFVSEPEKETIFTVQIPKSTK